MSFKYQFVHSFDGYDSNLLLLLHGLGDDYRNFLNFGKKLKLPQTALASLSAPLQVPFFEGYAWYDSFDLNTGEMKIPSENEVTTLRKKLLSFIEKEFLNNPTKTKNFKPEMIFLLGFGQGGQVLLDFGLAITKELKLGGIINIGGFRCNIPSFNSSNSISTPILTTLGLLDQEMLNEKEKTVNNFKNVQAFNKENFLFSLISDKGLEMPKSEQEMRIIMEFLGKHLFIRNLKLESMADLIEIK
ncbi:hypothetical protein HK099_002921 [Clydaea vesicula]|uniref:Phospholipase/carboxylesterase/thioesterase domain-containing protein n=1 Tax=Clydaea vesicula TaxID=447962 RepID=A0AAD5U7E8_9FUNG|nr:hypothetical protein HK099_002921 [Clydaea vesicula]KAJ3395698.1 hypothetical protein HDU92_005164 [Lobulomyces angularis]